jgi:hypothetical protein
MSPRKYTDPYIEVDIRKSIERDMVTQVLYKDDVIVREDSARTQDIKFIKSLLQRNRARS